MDVNVIAFLMCMGLCLVAGLVLYGTCRLSSEQINRIFGATMVIGAACNLVFNRTPHPSPPEGFRLVCGFMAVTGFMGLITDGVIFKFWKPKERPSTSRLPDYPAGTTQNATDNPYADGSLGGVVQAYRVPLPARLTAGIVSTIGTGLALLIAGLLAFGVRPSDLGATIAFDLFLALPIALLGAFLVWRCAQLWTLRATVYEGGVEVRMLRGGRRVVWGDVAGFRCDAARPAHIAVLVFGLLFCWIVALAYLLSWLRPRLRYRLVLASGETLDLPQPLVGRTSLAATVDRAVARQHLGALLSRYERGEALSFGAVMLDQAGLHTHKGLLPWADLHLLTRTATGFMIYRTGAQAAWATARLKDVLSPGLFAALVAAILDQKPGEAARDAV